MTSVSLADLPTEVLALIFSNFCLHCCGEHDQPSDIGTVQQHQEQRFKQLGRKHQKEDEKSWYSLDRHALFSLCLVSKRFQLIAQPILYHEFVLGHGDSSASWKYDWQDRITLFMRTVADRRDLALRVQRVSIQAFLFCPGSQEEGRNLKPFSVAEAYAVLNYCANALGIDLSMAWRQRISELANDDRPTSRLARAILVLVCNGDVSSDEELLELTFRHIWNDGLAWLATEMVTMLIAQLPNVQHLSVESTFNWENNHPTIRSITPSALAALDVSMLSVKTLDLSIRAEPFLELAPRLECLNIFLRAMTSPIPPMPSLKVLRVSSREMSKAEFESLLSACTGHLHTFVYEAGTHHFPPAPLTVGRGRNNFRLADAVRSLRRHRESLRSLHLDLSAQDVFEFSTFGDHGLETSLQDFPVLENLLISSCTIPIPADPAKYHFDSLRQHLPSSIVSLYLPHGQTEDHIDLKKELLRLAGRKMLHPGQFPSLRRIMCPDTHRYSDTTVEDMLAAVDVEFGYGDWPRCRFTELEEMYP
ncbi:hypothetical protein QQX98_003756 [Neonectria punicea]|uniref:F-box domain-containing protein n=1 Tax=Neonectria punicea TaxID=979145 RepID=A0ABR1HC47_9HYPO